ncbi:hypothetical protein K493DRAFT_354428 [Basidiobolus meristosporus CBS 931.73]|uniref:Protein Zds1 C-terminal domain-containing protein n=1 Tax=Basidiobolus meristosporus CBS 931.73 TaxID=1314790 RepID=A0A1Y1Y3M7_9FUNG|nr:hypothetical protein K493DRAFT_354428 [Basidiobolus meristosporus CBS 931.73]|eukprot:ORX92485.1 hypothetical protein K493DRAFT_354428 [Basidiobolus meristosporus CBS 931.73]
MTYVLLPTESEATLTETTSALTNELEENHCNGQNTLMDWALREEDPSHLYWVPAHLHPEIDPHQFHAWLQKHSSAVNSSENPLTRRKSILSLHSYDGTHYTEKFVTDETKTSKPPLTPSKLRRQLTVTDGMKIPRTKDESEPASSVFNTPFRIQSKNLRTSLKRSARTKVRRDSVKSTWSGSTCDLQEKEDGMQGEEDKVEETSPSEESSLSEATSLDDDSDDHMHGSLCEYPKSTTSDASISIQAPPPRSDSLPTNINPETHLEAPSTMESEANGESAPTDRKKKSYSWSRFWNTEPNFKPAKAKRTKKPSLDDAFLNFEGDRDARVIEATKQKTDSKPTVATFKKELVPPRSPSKNKKPSFLTLFTKSKKKGPSLHDGGGSLKTTDQPCKPSYQTDPRRLPIYIERGIYRLSHIKLTNPRRPLLQQVLISNMLYWYISVINQENFDPTFVEDPSTIAVQGKPIGGRRRGKRHISNHPEGYANGKRSEFLVKSPQYSRQQLRIYNSNMAIMPPTPPTAIRQHSTSHPNDMNLPMKQDGENENQNGDLKNTDDDNDELPLAIYKEPFVLTRLAKGLLPYPSTIYICSAQPCLRNLSSFTAIPTSTSISINNTTTTTTTI